ncbi:hypothetical protein N7474_004071 [Penicillium riverlandense]|uniref:uncharacterized protein n=1 Tax=Penicillium riverlandense TaxID=1903569 RepID=UPI00254730D4|nr:uncharacterized protein N7474_004071 [Penicillium riverlandense]KAJ5818480.1 hypothetical protein N7474_004071 [Penicillium riverlandense]
MAHHGNHRHSHISRLIKARQHRHQMEARDGQTEASDENGPDSLANSDPIRKPSLPVLDALAGESETCDPLQNVTCLEDIADVTIWKRDSTETDQQVVVETVVEVVDAQNHTLWQSTGTELPMTISDPSFGTITLSPGPSSTAEPSSVDGVAVLLSSQPRTSQSLVSPTRSPIPVAGAVSSAPPISTPLIGSATTASATKSTPLAHNNFLTPISASSSSSSETHSSHTSSSTSTTTGFFGGSGNTGGSTGSGSGTSPNDPSSGGSGSINPTTSKIVGGVVGTVAGIAMIILLLFYYLRRRGFFRNKTPARLGSQDETAGTREMASNDDSLFTASYFAPAFMNRWRNSAQTAQTDSTRSSNPSERGFQKISGRKIQSVLTSGGDGYGGSPPEDSPTLPPGLFSPTSPRASPSSHAPPPVNPFSSPLDSKYTRETEEPGAGVLRPSPARNPVPGSANVAMSTPITAQPQNVAASVAPLAAHRPDGLGRSFPSFDGSRGSRFQESLDL